MFRFLIQFLISFIAHLWRRDSWFGPGNCRAKLLLRGTIGTAGMLCYFYNLAYVSLADATIIVFTK